MARSQQQTAEMRNEFETTDAAREATEDLRAVGRDIDDVGLRAEETAEEFGGGYSLRLRTRNRRLPVELIDALSTHGCEVEYLGEVEDSLIYDAEWLLWVPVDETCGNCGADLRVGGTPESRVAYERDGDGWSPHTCPEDGR